MDSIQFDPDAGNAAKNHGTNLDGRLGYYRSLVSQSPVEDTYSRSQQPKTKSESKDGDGVFSFWTAAKEFVKGAIVRPVKAMIENPLITLGLLGASVLAIAIAPVTLPVMMLGGLAYGAYKGGTGVITAISKFQQGLYDDAEKAFGDIGEGVFAAGTSMLGARSAAAMVAEAKATTAAAAALDVTKRNAIMNQGVQQAAKIRSSRLPTALKEIASILTSAEGRAALWAQTKPSVFWANAKTKVNGWVSLFKDPPEINVPEIMKRVQKQYGIADEDMPRLAGSLSEIMGNRQAPVAGVYKAGDHVFYYPSDPVKLLANLLPEKRFNQLMKLPRPIRNAIVNGTLRRNLPETFIAHELTHSIQFGKIRHLSAEQAREILQGMSLADELDDMIRLTELMARQERNPMIQGALAVEVKRMKAMDRSFLKREYIDAAIRNMNLKNGKPKLTGQQLDELTAALQANLKTQIAGSYAMVRDPKYMRRYGLDPMEIDARVTGSAFQNLDDIVVFNTENAPISVNTARKVFNFRVEKRMNDLLAQMGRLDAATDSAKFAALETEIQALAKLKGTHSPTQSYIRQENIARKLQRWLNRGQPAL